MAAYNRGQMQASFQGLIGRVEIPDLFTFVHLGRRTGVTELTCANQITGGDQLTSVFFQKARSASVPRR